MGKKILLIVIIVFVISQFFRIDKSTPVTNPQSDLIASENPPQEISALLKQACYDCHSYETVYPWYMEVAPVSWWLKNHVNEGREHLNFSVWTEYSLKKKEHKMEELGEEVENGEMPTENYTWLHKESRLTDEQVTQLVSWSRTLRKKYKE